MRYDKSEKMVLFKGQKPEALGIAIHESLIEKIFEKYKIFTQKMKIPKATEAVLKL